MWFWKCCLFQIFKCAFCDSWISKIWLFVIGIEYKEHEINKRIGIDFSSIEIDSDIYYCDLESHTCFLESIPTPLLY